MKNEGGSLKGILEEINVVSSKPEQLEARLNNYFKTETIVEKPDERVTSKERG